MRSFSLGWIGLALFATACGNPERGGSSDGSQSTAGRPGSGPGGTAPGDGMPPAAPPSNCTLPASTGTEFYVAVDGSDESGDGSSGAPWASIDHALAQVTDGAVVLVRAGTYVGRVRLDEQFVEGVTVRSETLYQARLRHDDLVVSAYGAQGITLEGFDIAHAGPGAGALVVHVANVGTSRITLRNNILHDSFNNDVLKINNGAEGILVERNLFFNQQGSDEHIDVNSVRNIVIQDNVFVNDFAASGRQNDNSTSSFIVVKDSNGNEDGVLGAERIAIRRNVFANWEGSPGHHYVRLGEDGTANYEVIDAVIENNLMLGTSDHEMRAAFGCYGVRDVVFRHNTVVGDLPSLAFAVRMITVGDNQPNERIELWNNIWSDPTGTMEDFSDSTPGQTGSWTLQNNVYFNGAGALPEDGAELVNPSADGAAIVGDPGLGDPASALLPIFGEQGFADGSRTTCEAHERLIREHGVPGDASVALDAADPSQRPPDDILGRPRAERSDVGAVEVD